MAEPNWEAIERLLQPLLDPDPLHDAQMAVRLARHVDYLAEGREPFDRDKARLLCWFHGIRTRAMDPAERRHWMRPLREAGVPLATQTWLWIALERYLESPGTDEECVAHDAVALERVGAVGVARAFSRGGKTGEALSETVDVLRRNLAEAVFLTPAGRRLGVRRIVYTRRFLKELEDE